MCLRVPCTVQGLCCRHPSGHIHMAISDLTFLLPAFFLIPEGTGRKLGRLLPVNVHVGIASRADLRKEEMTMYRRFLHTHVEMGFLGLRDGT